MENVQQIYLDYNATTPLEKEVLEVIHRTLENNWGNPSSDYTVGKMARTVVSDAREKVALMIGAASGDIIFTSGGTEANNLVIHTAAQYSTDWKTDKSNDGFHGAEKPHIVTTSVEHDSVTLPLQYLQKQGKVDVDFVSVIKENGSVSAEDIISAVRPSTCLVTVMLANNETGILQPVAEIGSALQQLNHSRKKRGLCKILFHTDAAQAIGKVWVDVHDLRVDYLTVVGHKFYGPRVGALYARNPGSDAPLYPMFFGGGQERSFRPGTENTGIIAGLGKASELVYKNIDHYQKQLEETRDYLEMKLKATFGDRLHINGYTADAERLPNTSSVSIQGRRLQGFNVLSHCKLIQASVGAACHAQGKPSGILLASGVPLDVAANTVRLSVGRETTTADIDAAVDDLKQAVDALSS